MDLRGKKVTVFGLARSGVGAANLMSGLGAEVTVTDIRTESELGASLARLAKAVKRALGGHSDDVVMSSDLIVLSPGVPSDIPALAKATSKGIPVIGELELAYQVLVGDATGSSMTVPFLAVTGSNGKSTTTTLLDFMLRKGGADTIIGGNIGNALTEEIVPLVLGGGSAGADAVRVRPDYIVAEVSSFQLETIKSFRPFVSAVLNISPDHMDRYHSLSAYSNAKARIFENQRSGDFVVLNADDSETALFAEKTAGGGSGPGVLFFSRMTAVRGVYCREGVVYCNIPNLAGVGPHTALIHAKEIRIKGVHNLENAMAASAMALLANCPVKAVADSLREFGGLEHRLEFVRELDGVRYINDSKGTNVGAVEKSLEGFQEPVILIAGGRDKAGDFAVLKDLVSKRVKMLVLIGEAAGKIREALRGATITVMASDLKEAVEISRSRAAAGDVVLLSPACASFDMFRDFEDRGRQFKDIVMGLDE